MHLVQGTITTTVSLLTSAGGAVAFGAACMGARKELTKKQVPSLLAASGLVLVAQALNMATGFGFSGHMIGAALLAIAFGPWSAMLAIGLVLSIQAFALGDGSLSTLGANFLNMGLVASWSGYFAYQLGQKLLGGRQQYLSLGLAAYASTMCAALSLSLQVGGAFAGLLSCHALIALIEAGMSIALYALCTAGSHAVEPRRLGWKPVLCAALIACMLLPFASELPDGLEHSLSVLNLQ